MQGIERMLESNKFLKIVLNTNEIVGKAYQIIATGPV